MAEPSPAPGRWAFRPVQPEPRSIVELVRAGTLDAELAATLWLLIEGRVSLIVTAAEPGTGASTLLGALLDFVAPGTRAVELAGAEETFEWLPQAGELGWDGSPAPTPSPAATPSPATPPHPATDGTKVRPDTTVLVVPKLSDELPAYTWGAAARLAVRAASIGYGLAATIAADSLEDVFAALGRAPVSLSDDELSRLGVVLILRRTERGERRVVAAHYVRPLARDEHGHLQRLGPAVLATWDPSRDTFEHFGWAIVPELASRIGWRAGDLEREIESRREYLAGLAAAGLVGTTEVRAAIDGYRASVQTAPLPTAN